MQRFILRLCGAKAVLGKKFAPISPIIGQLCNPNLVVRSSSKNSPHGMFAVGRHLIQRLGRDSRALYGLHHLTDLLA